MFKSAKKDNDLLREDIAKLKKDLSLGVSAITAEMIEMKIEEITRKISDSTHLYIDVEFVDGSKYDRCSIHPLNTSMNDGPTAVQSQKEVEGLMAAGKFYIQTELNNKLAGDFGTEEIRSYRTYFVEEYIY